MLHPRFSRLCPGGGASSVHDPAAVPRKVWCKRFALDFARLEEDIREAMVMEVRAMSTAQALWQFEIVQLHVYVHVEVCASSVLAQHERSAAGPATRSTCGTRCWW